MRGQACKPGAAGRAVLDPYGIERGSAPGPPLARISERRFISSRMRSNTSPRATTTDELKQFARPLRCGEMLGLAIEVLRAPRHLTFPFGGAGLFSPVPALSSGCSPAASFGGKILSYIVRASRMSRSRSSSDFETNPTISPICNSFRRSKPRSLALVGSLAGHAR